MKTFYTYLYVDPKTNTPIYVGKGKNLRAYKHEKYKTRLGNTIRKRREEGYLIEPIITYEKIIYLLVQ